MKTRKSYLMLITSMLIFGTIGLFRRSLTFSSSFLAFLRGSIGGLFLLGWIYFKRKNLKFIFSFKQYLLLILAGSAMGVNWILLFEAYNYTSIAIATLCYYLQPTIVILLSPLIFKESLNKKKCICILFSLVGIILISEVGNVSLLDLKGILLALAAALLYALVVIINKLNPVEDALAKTVIQLLSAALVLIPYLLITKDIGYFEFNGINLLLTLIICLVHTGLAYLLYFGSINDLKSQSIAMLSYIDPLFAIVLSVLVLKEKMGILVFIGALCILGSTIYSELDNNE